MKNEITHQEILVISKEIGIPIKKIMDSLYMLKNGEPIDNIELIQHVGVSRNALNQVKKALSFLLVPPSKTTQLKKEFIECIKRLFDSDYKLEEQLLSIGQKDEFEKIKSILQKYSGLRPSPKRELDQFTATLETTVRRAQLLQFFGDVSEKRILFMGDDDFTSIAVASLRVAKQITVLDIDKRILDNIKIISDKENLNISAIHYDARELFPKNLYSKFDVVFTDPPYTEQGISLFLSRSIESLDNNNKAARIYFCYGNSDRAKERFLPIYDLIVKSGLMTRWIFDKFNRYNGAEEIGSSSSLFVCEITPKTKPLIQKKYDKPIYTNN